MSWWSLAPYLMAAGLTSAVVWPMARAPVQLQLADLRTEYAQLRESHAETLRLAAMASAQRLEQAQARGNQLTKKLLVAERANTQLTQEKKHALKAATDGRACLSDRALRVLDGATGLTVSGLSELPTPTGDAAAEGGTVATDSDLAQWALEAGSRFESCRERLDALIDWHLNPTTTEEPQREPAE